MVLDYIAANHDRVRRLVDFRNRFEKHLFEDDIEQIPDLVSEFDYVDSQSLLFLRMYASVHSADPDILIKQIKSTATSEFVRQALLYPLVYYFANLPRDIDLHLKYVLPGLEDYEADQCVVRYLLNDEVCDEDSLAFKSYVGLLVHPYDARELLLGHFERTCIAKYGLEQGDIETLLEIHDIAPDFRSAHVLSLALKPRQPLSSSVGNIHVADHFQISAEAKAVLTSLVSLEPLNTVRPTKEIPGVLWSMRATRYPEVRDYDEVTSLPVRYWFTEFGKFVEAYLVSLYLLPRGTTTTEIKHICRLRSYIGVGTPFVFAAPSGRLALQRYLSEDFESGRTALDSQLNRESHNDRLWLKVVQWPLEALQAELKISEWLALIRRTIPIAPDYLTGLSWQWLEDVIQRFRIRPFLNDANAVYVFLLRLIELRKNESNKLRAAIAPFSRSRTFEAFIEWLINEFQSDTAAFLRYFLTADMILYLQFTDNYVQALSFRTKAFETYLERFGFGPLLTEEQWQQEIQAFITELMLLNVGTNQFEINWEAIRRDITTKNEDLYKAYMAFRSQDLNSAVFTARKPFSHEFSTGIVVEFPVTVREIPGIHLLCNVIDAFIQHPSQGIEAVLSVRIRHNGFRRQFAAMLDRLKAAGSSPLTSYEIHTCVPPFEQAIYASVQTWVERYMHQQRPDKTEGLFEFVPTPAEMANLQSSLEAKDFPEIVEQVLQWIRSRLSRELTKARASLTLGLKAELDQVLSKVATSLSDEHQIPFHNIHRVEGILRTKLLQLCDDLLRWFYSSEHLQDTPVTGEAMRMSIEGFYENEVSQGRISLRATSLNKELVLKEHIRPMFNLIRTLVDNALEHGKSGSLSIRVRGFQEDGLRGIIFSSACDHAEPYQSEFRGDPQKAVAAPLFKEGKSGLYKVAAIAAFILQREAAVSVKRTKRAFHVRIPLAVA